MRQPRIRHNNYTALPIPEIGNWTPHLGVSIVIPAFQHQDKLEIVLASLAAQTYPSELLEVIIVDDGSEPRVRLSDLTPPNSKVIRSAPGGWGPAHAVNTGVAAASHDVIIRLDADVLVYREHIEAHMRWHHLADYLTVLGSLAFVDYETGQLTPLDVKDVVASGKAAELFDADSAGVSWVEQVLATTNNLLAAGSRIFRVATGATISFSRRLYDAAGGLDGSLILGSDTEFGYRLAQVGSVFVPEKQAKSWHLGQSQMRSRNEEGRRFRAPYLGQRVPPLRDFRRDSGRQWAVPYVDVVVEVEGHSYEEVKATVLGALTGSLPDIGVTLVGNWSKLVDSRRAPLDDPLLDMRLIRESFTRDSRVRFVESVPATSLPAPFRFRCPAGLVPTPDALRQLLAEADQHRCGLVLLPFPRGGELPIARLERTEAMARALVLREEDEDLEDVIHEVFGVFWISGAEWALVEAVDAPRPVTVKSLLGEIDKWKRLAGTRRTEIVKWKAEAAEWRRLAQVPLKRRLRQALKSRVVRVVR